MKSYDQAIHDIYRRADALIARRKERKKKFVLAAAPLSVMLLLTATVLPGMMSGKEPVVPPPIGSGYDEQTTATSTATTEQSSLSPQITSIKEGQVQEPSLSTSVSSALPDASTEQSGAEKPDFFPSVCRGLNAVLIRWGEPTGVTREDRNTSFCDESGTYRPVCYTEFQVEYVQLFPATMQETRIDYLDQMIEAKIPLLVPTQVAEQIIPGETALVFLERTTVYAEEHRQLIYALRPEIGWEKMAEGPMDVGIYPVRDGKLALTSEAIKPLDVFYVRSADYLLQGNRRIEFYKADIPLFRDGMTMEELETYFNYITK